MKNKKHRKNTAASRQARSIAADPTAKRYCFADQYEFILYAGHCKKLGLKQNVIWDAGDGYYSKYMEGFQLFEKGQYSKALDAYKASLKVNPVGLRSRFEMCECYLKLCRLDDAKRTLLDMQEYLMEATYVSRFYRRMGYIAIEQKDYRLALACLVFSLKFEKTPYAVNEILYVESIIGRDAEIGDIETIIKDAGLPILEGFIFAEEDELAG